MAAARPPSPDPPSETLDSSLIDETAPPMRSPLAGALPFGPPRPARPLPGAPSGEPPLPAFIGLPAGLQAPRPPAPFGEETAPAERSPLAAALPFRHARPLASTMAIPRATAEDLKRLGLSAQAPAPAEARARLEMARTVDFAMPPMPPDRAPVAATSTGHFGLSIEHYAALCAELAVSPQSADTTFARYGLASSKDRLTADLAWQDRLRADNALMQRWQTLYLHYHEHYHERARGR